MGTDKPCFDKISIDNYISNEYSICREERQYALYLNNILMKYRKKVSRENNKIVEKVFEACGLDGDVDIDYVFYEATFMRDIFERNRRLELNGGKDSEETIICDTKFKPDDYTINPSRSFNRVLNNYLRERNLPHIEDIGNKEYHLGGNKFKITGTDKTKDKSYERLMMNSKPDIAVIYKKDGQRYLHFIECKFESGESTNGDLKQSEIQWYIADFLCQNYFKDENYFKDVKVSPEMKNNKSCLVQFTRKESQSNKIWIKNLIDLNNEIFGI